MISSTDSSTVYTLYTFLDGQANVIQEVVTHDVTADVYSETHGWIELQELLNTEGVIYTRKSFTLSQLEDLLSNQRAL